MPQTVTPVPDRDAQSRAREIVQRWLRSDRDAFASLGQKAIRAASDATIRLSRFEGSQPAEHVLAELEALAAGLSAPPPAPQRWWARKPSPSEPAPTPAVLERLTGQLDRQRDEVLRRLLALETDRTRLAEESRGLEDATALLRALPAAVEAAAREIRGDDRAHAATLLAEADAALAQREQAVLTQMVVHRQAIMTLDLIIANHTTLSEALERARGALLAALRTATAARRATRDAGMSARGAAAARNGEAGDAGNALTDAVRQARKALASLRGSAGR